jgi:hypothetical protein
LKNLEKSRKIYLQHFLIIVQTRKQRKIKMRNATITEIKHAENSLETSYEFGIEINLEQILAVEFNEGLSSDINNFN